MAVFSPCSISAVWKIRPLPLNGGGHYPLPWRIAQQVEEEVTLPLENALQQLPYLDNVSSISSNGLSQITVNIASNYHSNELPQIWDELRRGWAMRPASFRRAWFPPS
ncbi:hypothetical protein UA70_01240 [Raoultella planticola]|nr:hypothetical protein UA70_01240 [Raoultella planticola]